LTTRLPKFHEIAFDPGFELGWLSRGTLAELGREWLLHGHLQDRAGMPLYLARATREDMEALAIDEWMSASPLYAQRMQRALGFVGHDVPTIFKNLQLDIGAPHQFMDFRYRVTDAEHGEFWLAHCGALMDVEPLGEDFVVGMCHHIEDPTFDATAGATNPRAQVRPLHRPPRVPSDRHPHCHWTVTIDPQAEPVQEHPNLPAMRRSRLAALPVPVASPVVSGGGWPDYHRDFDPDFVLEDLSRAALVIALDEFAVQSHLLFRAYLMSLAQRVGDSDALDLGYRTFLGLAGITAARLRPATAVVGSGAEAIAALIQLHPAFHPRSYINLSIEVIGDNRVRLAIGPCPALEEPDPFTWLACLDHGGLGPLDAIVRAVNTRARCRAAEARPGEARAYEVHIEANAEPTPEPPEMSLVRFSTGAGFTFRPA